MAVNDIFQINMIGQLHGQATVNTFHYRVSVQGTGDAEPVLLPAFHTAVGAKVKIACSNEWSLVRTTVQKIRPLPPRLALETVAGAGPGALFQESMPTSIAVVVSKRTILAGRAYRGRCYFAGISAAHEIDSQLTTAGALVWDDVATGMETSLIASGYTFVPVVFHRGDGTSTDIISSLVRLPFRNQRRRQVGKGI